MAKCLIHDVTWRSTTLVVFETILLVGAVALAAWVRLGSGAWSVIEQDNGLLKTLLIAYACQLCLYYNDLYDDPRVGHDRRELLVRIFQSLGATSLILATIYFWFPAFVLGRGVFALAAVFIVLAVVGWRVGFMWLAGRVGPRERFLLVGTSAEGIELARELHQRRDLGVEIVGFVDPDPSRIGAPLFNPAIIGTIDDIPSIVRDRSIDKVVVSLADAILRLAFSSCCWIRMGMKYCCATRTRLSPSVRSVWRHLGRGAGSRVAPRSTVPSIRPRA